VKICVYGASSNAIDSAYLAAGEQLGRELAKRGHGLVFGGGADGMMGALARGVHACGGEIIGVAPSFFNVDGILFEHCTEMIYTKTMRERKQIMEDAADAFVMTAGGIGTFEEFFEILTLRQLGQHQKPIAVLNTKGYYDPMEAMLRQAVEQKFMKQACMELYGFFHDADALLNFLEQPPTKHADFVQMKYTREEEK
jgi:uncharacterized protein (TIGR00730 family)